MKVAHLMKITKFTDGVVRFIDKFFGDDMVVYYNDRSSENYVVKGVSVEQRNMHLSCNNIATSAKLIKYLEGLSVDYIFLHSCFLKPIEELLLLSNKQILSKLIWIEWGADLYSWESKSSGLKDIIREKINYRFRVKTQNIVCIFPPDMDYYRKRFPKSHAQLFYAPYAGYPLSRSFSEYSDYSQLKEDLSAGEPIYIQVGQNAMPTLNHIRSLKALSKFAANNIRIVLPLSYGGSKSYVDEVISYANELFPNKTIILKDFMPASEYFELMKKISIAVFDTERQCALGNINTLIFRNKKIFLSRDGVMYKFFLDNGVPVEPCEELERMTYSEFTKPLELKNASQFYKYLYSVSDCEPIVEKWMGIYRKLKNMRG